ncbi:MAG: hypothetical protein H8E13_05830 [Actinobacteria bacterium]|nr:hypothetical protein [Actinomycetota bacterium]
MNRKIQYIETSWFKKDFKKLIKRFKTLKGDLDVLKRNQIELLHLFEIDNDGTFKLKGYRNPNYSIYKIKKIACKSLKGKGSKSGLRLIYAFNQNSIQISLLEIYYKGDKENEDYDRIKKFLL